MKHLLRALLPIVGLVVLLCTGWMAACPDAASCAATVGASGVAIAAALVMSAFLTAWVARVAWVLAAARRATTALHPEAPPAGLVQAARRTSVRSIRFLPTDEPTAFCGGALRPAVYVSRGLVSTLRPEELDAVLLHEAHHGRRLDPLRRAVTRALADIAFFCPLVRWWSDQQVEASELAADRAVMVRLGPKPLAGALWVVGEAAAVPGAGFAGTAELRAAQLLGQVARRRRPPLAVLTSSAAGLLMSVALASCLLHVAASLG